MEELPPGTTQLVLIPASRREAVYWAFWAESYGLLQAWRKEPLHVPRGAKATCERFERQGHEAYLFEYEWLFANSLVLAAPPQGWEGPIAACDAETVRRRMLRPVRSYVSRAHRRSVSLTYVGVLLALLGLFFALKVWVLPGSVASAWLLAGFVVLSACLPLGWAILFYRLNQRDPRHYFELSLLRWETAVFSLVMLAAGAHRISRVPFGHLPGWAKADAPTRLESRSTASARTPTELER